MRPVKYLEMKLASPKVFLSFNVPSDSTSYLGEMIKAIKTWFLPMITLILSKSAEKILKKFESLFSK